MRSVNQLSELLTNPSAREILKSCKGTGKTVYEVSKNKDIPLSKCFELSFKLEKAGLLRMVEKCQNNKKMEYIYKTTSNSDSVSIMSEKRNMRCKIRHAGVEISVKTV